MAQEFEGQPKRPDVEDDVREGHTREYRSSPNSGKTFAGPGAADASFNTMFGDVLTRVKANTYGDVPKFTTPQQCLDRARQATRTAADEARFAQMFPGADVKVMP